MEIERADQGTLVEYIPHCALDHKSYVGRRFPILDDAKNFYIKYALRCGFKHHLGSAKRLKGGETSRWYIMCSREGFKKDSDSCKKRSRMSTRVGCNARVTIRLVHGIGYVVTEFIEAHSHEFVSESHSQFMRLNRNLDSGHKKFVLNCVRANIGHVKSFRLFKELVGGYDKVGCTIVDFKNFTRDLRAHAVGVDAQILLNNFHSKREICKGFSFDYCVDSSDKLTRLFWADPISIGMYKLFGEAVSFDATYSTNRYNLIFVQFMGKDNHGKCATFAAGLISHEDEESYSWILQKFIDCMGKKPKLIITDQDPALKKAVERVLVNSIETICFQIEVGLTLPINNKP